ncbi:MAG: hypothetical protein MUF84_11030 [Anaerolineae bacterium]|jgi:hypothetical protein|nr:hypothetical protein [Anaerolineae bacterium]
MSQPVGVVESLARYGGEAKQSMAVLQCQLSRWASSDPVWVVRPRRHNKEE